MQHLLDDDELWTHAKVTNPANASTLGYWWTCAAHEASPGTRILAPAQTGNHAVAPTLDSMPCLPLILFELPCGEQSR